MRTQDYSIDNCSKHAELRSQQRGVPPLVIEWLLRFGDSAWDHRGGQVKYFTRRSRHRVENVVGHEVMRRLHEFLDCYAVVATDGTLITCGHRYKRILKH